MGLLLSIFKSSIAVGDRSVTVIRRLGEGGFGIVDLVHVWDRLHSFKLILDILMQDRNTGLQYALKRTRCADEVELNTAVRETEKYSLFHSKYAKFRFMPYSINICHCLHLLIVKSL